MNRAPQHMFSRAPSPKAPSSRTFWARVSLSAPGIVVLLAVLTALGTRADMIVLRDGHEYEGRLLEANEEGIRFSVDERVRHYDRAEVVHIRLQREREWAGKNTVEAIGDSDLHEALTAAKSLDTTDGAGYHTLLKRTRITLGGAFTWRRQHREILRILREHGQRASIQHLRTHREAETSAILHAVSIRPDGSVLHLRDTALQSEAPHQAHPRYDKLLARRFAMPEGKPGTTLDFAFQVNRSRPLHGLPFAEDFLFAHRAPARRIEVEITLPVDVPFRWRVLNDPHGVVHHESVRGEDSISHRWVRKNAPRLEPEPRMPPLNDLVPRLLVAANDDTWEELAIKAETRVKKALAKYDIPPPDPPDGNAQQRWETISTRLQPVNVPTTATGYTPGDPNQTLNLRQGAPVDRAAILYAWLQQTVPDDTAVRWGWVRPRRHGKVGDIPRLNAFSVPVTALVRDGKPVQFLIPGDALDAFQEPERALAGSPCLLAGFGRTRLPVPSASWRGQNTTVEVQLLDNGDAHVRETLVCSGPAARPFRKWRRKTEEEIANEVRSRVQNTVSGAYDIGYETNDDWALNQPTFRIVFRYKVRALADIHPTIGSLRPPWFDYNATLVGRDQRTFPLFWKSPRHRVVDVHVQTPDGHDWTHLPEPATTGVPDKFSLKAQRVQGGAGAHMRVEYRRTAIDLPRTQYGALKTCLQQRAAIGREYWIVR